MGFRKCRICRYPPPPSEDDWKICDVYPCKRRFNEQTVTRLQKHTRAFVSYTNTTPNQGVLRERHHEFIILYCSLSFQNCPDPQNWKKSYEICSVLERFVQTRKKYIRNLFEENHE